MDEGTGVAGVFVLLPVPPPHAVRQVKATEIRIKLRMPL
jgi:hypothetical protein